MLHAAAGSISDPHATSAVKPQQGWAPPRPARPRARFHATAWSPRLPVVKKFHNWQKYLEQRHRSRYISRMISSATPSRAARRPAWPGLAERVLHGIARAAMLLLFWRRIARTIAQIESLFDLWRTGELPLQTPAAAIPAPPRPHVARASVRRTTSRRITAPPVKRRPSDHAARATFRIGIPRQTPSQPDPGSMPPTDAPATENFNFWPAKASCRTTL